MEWVYWTNNVNYIRVFLYHIVYRKLENVITFMDIILYCNRVLYHSVSWLIGVLRNDEGSYNGARA